VFVADDLAAWLVGLLADAGRRKLTRMTLGTDQQRALRSAATEAVRLTAEELRSDNAEQAEQMAMVLSQVFSEPVPSEPLATRRTVLEALQAGIAEQLAVLDDASLTGIGQSSADALGVSGVVLAEKLTRHLVREIVARGARGEPLFPLASQLNHDVTHLQGQRLESKIDRLAGDVMEVLSRLATAATRELDSSHGTQPASAIVGAALPIPRQLPVNPTHFTGRDTELVQLSSLLELDSFPTVLVVTGTAGVGKTALIVHWAHRERSRFVDGELYVDLQGFGQSVPLSADEVLGDFLRALNIPQSRIPLSLDARAALYRSVMASKRILVVLDNAADSAQVRPLLPASQSSVVVVTSRRQLSGLVARDGAYRLTLPPLPQFAATLLLRRILGSKRISDEPELTARLIHLCAALPLALRIAAEQLLNQPGSRFTELLDELTIEHDRLSVLATNDDENTAIRPVFSWSYQALSPEDRRIFRVLGLHPGPDISLRGAIALLGSTADHLRDRFRSLTDAHLLEQIAADRYRFHDLLHLYANERAGSDEPCEARVQAISRNLTWYFLSAVAAMRLMTPQPPRINLDIAKQSGESVAPLVFEDRRQAVEWYDREHLNLVAVIKQAVEAEAYDIAWKLPAVLWEFFNVRKHWSSWIYTHELGLTAAEQSDDKLGQARILNNLGTAYLQRRKFEDALTYLEKSLAASQASDDRYGQAVTLNNVGACYRGLRRLEEALQLLRGSFSLWTELGEAHGAGSALISMGATYYLLDRYEDAGDCYSKALTLFRSVGDRRREGICLHNLGEAYLRLDHSTEARKCLEQALAICRETFDHHCEAWTLYQLGESWFKLGRRSKALEMWRQALSTLSDIEDPKIEEVRQRIAEVESQR
jgi:tetratricopeptide (TPR) repeat protein